MHIIKDSEALFEVIAVRQLRVPDNTSVICSKWFYVCYVCTLSKEP
jgi:hypothetical protein